jgi:predicted amidohydrolase YtcJ
VKRIRFEQKNQEGILMKRKKVGNRVWLLVLLAVPMTLSFMCSTANATDQLADVALINGKVITVDKIFSIKEAIAIKGDTIRAVGTNAQIAGYIGENTRIIDLEGKTVLPGFNDSHAHPAEQYVMQPPLTLALGDPSITSIADIQAAVAARVAQVAPGQWIHGDGWDPDQLTDCVGIVAGCLNKGQLDAVSPNNPCAFTDFTGHNLWANSMALELAGIDKNTPDPSGGIIERDEEGNPTGILTGLAAMDLVAKVVPPWTDEELRDAALYGMRYSNTFGITSFSEGCIGPGHETYAGGVMSTRMLKIYEDLCKEGLLTARVSIMISFVGLTRDTTLENLKNGVENFDWPTGYDPKWLRFPGIKLFADGVPTDQTSAMWEEYIGGGYGFLLIPGATEEKKAEELKKMIEYGHSKGFQVAIHATGDRAITACVDGFESALQKYPKNHDPRHYVIHGDFVRPEDAARLAGIECGVNMNPDIKALISDFEPDVVGSVLAAYEFPYRTAFDAGIPVAFGSDTITVTEPNPLHGIQSAITRESFSGIVSGFEQAATRREAIRAYTINGAWQDFMEQEKGSIEVGKLADFCVLDQDIMTVEAHTIGNIKVVMTIVGGKIVYDAYAGNS